MLQKLKSEGIENIYLFVCDSLRWDFAPHEILSKGIAFKTIASSLFTASSFPSICTGLYPPKHGILSWENRLSRDIRSLFNVKGFNSSLWVETMWVELPPNDSELHEFFQNPQGVPLRDIEPPFIFVEHDKGGHSPYGLPLEKYSGTRVSEFYAKYGSMGRNCLIEQYRQGVSQSVDRFKKGLDVLGERGLMKKTLVLFTSDHGELLGEYGGLTGHNRPACPELVYVPSVFIHPSLNPPIISGGVLRHVDIFPTLMGAVNIDVQHDCDGQNLCEEDDIPKVGFNFMKSCYLPSKQAWVIKWLQYDARSVWDRDGGHVFHVLGFMKSTLLFFFRIFIQKNAEFSYMLQYSKRLNLMKRFLEKWNGLRHLSDNHIEYLNPCFCKREAREMLGKYASQVGEVKAEYYDMNDEARQRLEALGYID